MKNVVIPLLANKNQTTNDVVNLRQLFVSRPSYLDYGNFPHPREFNLEIDKVTINSDFMPVFLPYDHLRFPIPFFSEAATPFRFDVRAEEEDRYENMCFALIGDIGKTRLQETTTPYMLVWRFEVEPLERQNYVLQGVVRIPTGKYFIPVMSYSLKSIPRIQQQEFYAWETIAFNPCDRVQVFDNTGRGLGQSPFPIQTVFPVPGHLFGTGYESDFFRWIFPEAWQFNARLEAQVNLPIASQCFPGYKIHCYFIIVGILVLPEDYKDFEKYHEFTLVPNNH